MPRVTAVVLAAGLGTRMQSAIPKVLHPVAHRPMIRHLIMTLETALHDEEMSIAVVIGPEMPTLAAAVAPHASVVQTERRGTGHAVHTALPALPQTGTILILMGDTPLLRPETIRRLIAAQRAEGAAIVLGAFRPTNPSGFGRILKAEDGSVARIVEERDLTPEQKEISLCNSGLYAVEASRLPGLLARLTPNNAQGEFYLTDIVAQAVGEGAFVQALEFPAEEAQGVNSRADLALVESLAQARYRKLALDTGVTLLDPGSVYFAADTIVGRDVTIGPNVVFGPGVQIADRVTIHAFSHIEGTAIASGASIGPFARLRPGTRLEEGVHIGNFVEVKNAALGPGVKANHLAYLGDTDIGARSNIGAGTITCNYDGINKHRTVIGEDAFIGSNSALVAPVTIGGGALVGAGSVITRNVPADAIAVVRGGLTQKEGAAKGFREARRTASMGKKD